MTHYSYQLVQSFPDIFRIDHTGGGCDALVMELRDGDHAVLVANCAAPESPQEIDDLSLLVYPAGESGWEGDSSGGVVLCSGTTTAAKCVDLMLAMDRVAKEFVLVYSDVCAPSQRVRTFTGDEITDSRGFDGETQDTLFNMELMETVEIQGLSGLVDAVAVRTK